MRKATLRKNLGLLALTLCSCVPWVDSPFSDQLLHKRACSNSASLSKLGSVEEDQVVRIAIFSDAHQNYRDLQKVIAEINDTTDVDFVVNLGDFTNTGYNIEYAQYLDFCEALTYPQFTVMGNHDALGAGKALFRKAFGESNFWFESDSYRYIFFNSANLEDHAGFQPHWLQEAVDASAKDVLIFSHIHLQSAIRFNNEVLGIFDSIIQNPNVKMIFNGHNHRFDMRVENGTVLLQAGRVEGRHWLYLELTEQAVRIQKMDLKEVLWHTFD